MKLYLKILTLLLISISCLTNLHSQSKELILYKDFYYFNSRPFLRFTDFEPKAINNYGWSIAYKKMKSDRKYNQFEAKVIFESSDEADNSFKRKEFLLNYRKGKYLKKKLFNVLKMRYGPSLNLRLLTEDLEPGLTREFPRENILGGLGLSVLAGLEYPLSDKLNIHLDTNLFGLSFSLNYSYFDNPALTERQKQQGGFDFDLFGERTLKIGIGYILNNKEE